MVAVCIRTTGLCRRGMADVNLHPRATKFSLLSFYARRHSREITYMYQALPLFLRASLKSWEWPGDKAK